MTGLVGAAASLTGLRPVSADNFSGATGTSGCLGGLNMANSGLHNVSGHLLEDHTYAAQSEANDFISATTNVAQYWTTSPIVQTDIVAFDENYVMFCGTYWDSTFPGDKNVWGKTICYDLHPSNGRCDQHRIFYDEPDMAFLSYTNPVSAKSLAIHESGHSLGLKHRDAESGVMQTYGPYPSSFTNHDLYLHLGPVY